MDQNIPDFKTKKRYFCSWSASIPAFAETLARLRKGALKEGETCSQIYESAGKYVFRGKMDGFDFAYKTQQGKAFWRYLFRNSLPLRECFHYAVLRNLGIPVPQVLAVGDTRKCFILKESFLVTEFLDRTEDGRVFMPGEKFRSGHEELRHAFAEKHLRELAKLHDGGYFHKAFHPRNRLFRGDSPEEMEISEQGYLQFKNVTDTAAHTRNELDFREIVNALHHYWEANRIVVTPGLLAVLSDILFVAADRRQINALTTACSLSRNVLRHKSADPVMRQRLTGKLNGAKAEI